MDLTLAFATLVTIFLARNHLERSELQALLELARSKEVVKTVKSLDT